MINTLRPCSSVILWTSFHFVSHSSQFNHIKAGNRLAGRLEDQKLIDRMEENSVVALRPPPQVLLLVYICLLTSNLSDDPDISLEVGT